MAANLDQSALFKDLTMQEQWKLKAICKRETYRNGQFIFRRADPPGPLYIVSSGQVRVSVQTNGGEEMIALLEEGHHLGEMSFIERSPRSTNAIANADPTVLTVIDDEKLRKLMEENKMIEYRVLRVFTDTLLPRLKTTSEEIASTLAMALAETDLSASEAMMSRNSFEYREDAASILARGEDLRDAAIVDKAFVTQILWLVLPRLCSRLREIDRRLQVAKEL